MKAAKPRCVAASQQPLARLFALLLFATTVQGADLAAPLAGQTLRPGLLVDLGCSDELLAYAADPRFLVHGIARDEAMVAHLRAALAQRGLATRASVERGDCTILPYADRMVDVLVAAIPVDHAEVHRVLTPGGAAFMQGLPEAQAGPGAQLLAGGWTRIDQPLSAELDEWSHYLHDAGNSAASTDTMVGWPDQLRFVAGRPYAGSLGRWSSGFTSAGGRNFYASPVEPADRAPARALTLLEARNAYNGLLLWRRYFDHGPLRVHWSTMGYTVDAERVYVPYDGGFAALSAATGKDLWRVADPDGTAVDQVQVADGVVVRNGRSVRAFAADTGTQRWRMDLGERGSSIALGDGHLFCALFKEWSRTAIELRCCDAGDGSLRWTKPLKEGKEVFRTAGSIGLALQYRSGRVALSTPGLGGWAGMVAFICSAKDGALLWTTKTETNAPLIFRDDAVINQLTTCDPATGAVTATVAERGKFAGNCGRTFASAGFFLGGRLGFMDRATGEARYYQLTSGGCTLGAAYPANGLANFTRQTCTCYTLLQGHLAFAAAPAGSADRTVADSARIEAGPAFGKVAASAQIASSWPTFRHDPLRSGASATNLPGSFSIEWQTRVGGRPTAPVSDGVNAYLAIADERRVVAIRLADGAQQWSFTADGPIDSPPTLSGGYAVFGCRDGRVYALRAADGVLAWRYLVAPSDRRIVAFERLESSWPVVGSVLIREGMVYALAGRHSQIDGGMWLVGLRLDSGAAAWRRRIGVDLPDPRLALVNDVLRSDGLRLYLTAFGQWTGQDKYAYDFATGARVHLTQDGKTPAGPLISAEGGMLIDGRERIATSVNHTEMRRVWYYAPDRNLSGSAYPGVNNQQIAMNPANGYRGDALAFGDDRVAGCARTYPQDANFPEFASGQERPVIYGTSTLARAPWAFDPRRSAFDLRALVLSADKVHVTFAGSDPEKPEPQLLTLDAATGELLSSLPLPASPRWDGMMVTDGRLLLTTEDGRLISLFQPARSPERGWSLPSGKSVARELVLDRATLPLPLEVRWRYQLDEATLGEGTQSWTDRASIPERMSVTLPAATPAGDAGTASLSVETWSGATMRSREARAVRLVKDAAVSSGTSDRPSVWDPSSAVQHRLQARGVAFTEVTQPWALPAGMLQLIVGANALTAEQAQDPRWRALIVGGCRVLMLEQRQPLAAATLGLDFTTVDGSERRALLVDGPAVAGLDDADLRGWPGEALLAERSLLPGKVRLRPLVRTADGKRLLVVDLRLGEGRLILSHLALGAGLLRDDVVCRRLFDDLVDADATYLSVHLASALDPASPTGQLLAETGLDCIAASDVIAALRSPQVNLVVADATPALLAQLADASELVGGFTQRGGWLLLCGLHAEDHAAFARLVGYDHLIRPWEPARIALPARVDPLVAGIAADDLQLRSAVKLEPTWLPATDAWTAVPDGDDLAPFCLLPGPETWGTPNATLGSDRFPRNLVNGFSASDSWRLSFTMPIGPAGVCPIEMRLPQPRRLRGFAIQPGMLYRRVTSLRLVFDGRDQDALTIAVRPVNERQDTTFDAPRTAQTVRVEMVDWTKDDKNAALTLDNLWLLADRSAEQRRDVRPLTEPAVLMAYPRARGGILLDQLRAIAACEIAAAKSTAESTRLTENRAKQKRVLAMLLWNLGARPTEPRP